MLDPSELGWKPPREDRFSGTVNALEESPDPWVFDHCMTAVSDGSARPDLLGDPWIGDKAGALGQSCVEEPFLSGDMTK
jgi:hypothetical protein